MRMRKHRRVCLVCSIVRTLQYCGKVMFSVVFVSVHRSVCQLKCFGSYPGASNRHLIEKVNRKKGLANHASQRLLVDIVLRGESDEPVVRRQQRKKARKYTLALKPRPDITRSPKQRTMKKTDGLQFFLMKGC